MAPKEASIQTKEHSFSEFGDQIRSLINTTVDNILGTTAYDATEVPSKVDGVTAGVLDSLQKLSDRFKYIVTVVILPRSNSGFHLFSTCYWDQALDGTVTVQWENKFMHCIVTVFGVAL